MPAWRYYFVFFGLQTRLTLCLCTCAEGNIKLTLPVAVVDILSLPTSLLRTYRPVALGRRQLSISTAFPSPRTSSVIQSRHTRPSSHSTVTSRLFKHRLSPP